MGLRAPRVGLGIRERREGGGERGRQGGECQKEEDGRREGEKKRRLECFYEIAVVLWELTGQSAPQRSLIFSLSIPLCLYFSLSLSLFVYLFVYLGS